MTERGRHDPAKRERIKRAFFWTIAALVGVNVPGSSQQQKETLRSKDVLGGEWVSPPSPPNNAEVGSKFTLAAWAAPIDENPPVAYLQFTIYRDGAHLPDSDNPYAWPIIGTVKNPVHKDEKGRNIYEVNVDLTNIPGFPPPAPGDTFEVSFDVYDTLYQQQNQNGALDKLPDGNPRKEANRKRAPNGEHTLRYNPILH